MSTRDAGRAGDDPGAARRTQLLSVASVAAQFDCSRGHVYRLIATGKLRAVELKASGGRPKTRVRLEDVEAFIEAHTRTAPQ